MKKLLQIIIIAILCNVHVYPQQWSLVSEPDIKETLNDIFFISENEGWAVGEAGLIIHTTDGGNTWSEQASNTSKGLTKIFFCDSLNGWVGTVQSDLSKPLAGSIFRTTDGGAIWTEIDFSHLAPSVSFTYCDGVFFTSPSVGHMLAGKYKKNFLFNTSDGGLHWTIKDSLISSSSKRWNDLRFYDANRGVIVGNRKEIQKYTTNGGKTWKFSEPINDNFFRELRAVRWLSSSVVIALGEGNDFYGIPTPVYKSVDGGKTWKKKTQSPTNSFNRVKDAYFKNANDGIGMGSNGFSYVFIYKTSDGGETWTPSSAPYAFGIKAISGIGEVIYALGSSSHIIKSTDFGETWNIFPIKPPAGIYGLQFVGGRGYAVTRNSDVIISNNGAGFNWEYASSCGNWETGAAYFLSKNVGFVLKENRHIVKTTDGGLTWETVLEPYPFNSRNKVGGITFPDQNTGFAWVSLNDYAEYYVYKSTDGGNNWNLIWSVEGPGYLSGDIGFFDAESGFLAGPDMWLQYTTDGGKNWAEASINNFPAEWLNKDFEDVSVIDESTAFAVGNNFILKTSDKGATWENVDHGITGIDSSFYTVAFFDENIGYIGCYDGIILQTKDGGVSWNKDETYKGVYNFYSSAFNENGKVFFGASTGSIIGWDVTSDINRESLGVLPKGFYLGQNYPNPFNPTTTIKYSIPHSPLSFQRRRAGGEVVTLKIYDALGKEVSILVDEEKAPGNYSIEIDASNLASGIYYYKLSAGKFAAVKKMIILK